MIVEIKVKQLPAAKGLPLPHYATDGSSGVDLTAAIEEELVIGPGEFRRIPTGLSVEIPPGFEAQVRPRSGLAHNHGIGVLNAPGTIDSDYRGEIGVILINFGDEPFTIQRGDRIAQMVFASVTRATLQRVSELNDTRRGQGGFGHTGR